MKKILSGTFVVLFFASGFASAQVSKLINFQGRLIDKTSGDPITESKSVVFKLYTGAVVVDSTWTETQTVTPDSNGIYSVLLASVTVFPSWLTFTQDYWLGVKVGDDAEMTPRFRLTPAPYAVGATYAKTPTAASHIATKGYVDAAGGAKKWYRTSSTADGLTADDLCAAGYHMCYPMEWIGRVWDSGQGSTVWSEDYVWVDTHSGTTDETMGNCANWTSDVWDEFGWAVYPDDSVGLFWYCEPLACDEVYPTLCCED